MKPLRHYTLKRLRYYAKHNMTALMALQGVLVAGLFFLFCVRWRLSFGHYYKKMLVAQRRGIVRILWLQWLALPLSDEKSVFNGGIHDSFVSPAFSHAVVVGHRRFRFRHLWHYVFVIGAGALKRIGAMREVSEIAQRIVSHSKDARLRALAFDTLGDMEHLLLLWQQSIRAEGHVNLFGRTSFFVHPEETFFTHEHLRADLAAAARGYYEQAREADPAYGFMHYELARLSRHEGKWQEALEEMQRYAQWVATQYTRLERRTAYYDWHVLLGLLGQRPLRKITEENMPLIYGKSGYGAHNVRLVNAMLLDDEEVTCAYRHNPTYRRLPGHTLRLDYAYYEGGNRAVRMEREVEIPPVHQLVPARARIGANYMMHSVLDDRYIMKASRIYDSNQFNLFDNQIIRFTDKNALVALVQPVLEIDKPLLVCQGYADNYYHFLFDCLGTLAFVPKEELSRRTLVFGGGNPKFTRYQRELMRLCGVGHVPAIKMANDTGYMVGSDVLITSNPNRTNVAHPDVIRFLRARLMQGRECAPRRGKRIFFYRAQRRRIPNKNLQHLTAFLRTHGFGIINPEGLSVNKQRELLKDAEILVMEIGGSAANLLFCPSGCQVVMLSCEFGYRDIFTPITQTLGQHLRIVFSSNNAIYPKPSLAWSEVWLSLSHQDAINAVQDAIHAVEASRQAGGAAPAEAA